MQKPDKLNMHQTNFQLYREIKMINSIQLYLRLKNDFWMLKNSGNEAKKNGVSIHIHDSVYVKYLFKHILA